MKEEIKKLNEAIKFFEEKIEKQKPIYNERDIEHLYNLRREKKKIEELIK